MRYPEEYVKNLRRLNAFNVLYVPYWFKASDASDAQVVDLDFLKKMERFATIDEVIATAVLKTWNRHTEFLSPEFSFLSLTSELVSPQEKSQIAAGILSTPKPPSLPPAPLKPVVPITSSVQLHQLAKSPRAHLPFLLLEASEDFLHLDPSEWSSEPGFQRIQNFVKNYRVVNDVAEHFVQVATDYNNKITRNETQRQHLYATVENQRGIRSDLRKKSLQPTPPPQQPSRHAYKLRKS